jgi:hypothetical protein
VGTIPAGVALFKAAERLLTVAQAPPATVGLEVTEDIDVAMQLQALEIRNEGLPTWLDLQA